MKRWLRRVLGLDAVAAAAPPGAAERLEAARQRLKETIGAPPEEPSE